MTSSDDKFIRSLTNVTEVPFSDKLKSSILQAAKQMDGVHPSKPRPTLFRTVFAGVGGIAAASLLLFTAWNYSGTLSGHLNTTSSQSVPVYRLGAMQVPGAISGQFGLLAAPISIGYIGLSRTADGSEIVMATVTNVGTKTLTAKDLLGVLSFQPKTDEHLLQATDWITFVKPPHAAIQPGETVSWTFKPIGVPTNRDGSFKGAPELVFFQRGLTIPSKADVHWLRPAMSIAEVSVEPRYHWKTGQSIGVSATLHNISGRVVQTKDLLAIVWFSPKATESDWTHADVVKFMALVAPSANAKSIPANGSAQVYFRLIGGPSTPFMAMTPHVDLIWR
jgi:hypothetical protein